MSLLTVLRGGSENSAPNEPEIEFTPRGALLLLFLMRNKDGKKVKLFKRLFAQRIVKNGLIAAKFYKFTNQTATDSVQLASELTSYIESLSRNKDSASPFIDWLYGQGYISDTDVLEVHGMGGS